MLVLSVVRQTDAQANPSPFVFRAGQSIYIVAFRRMLVPNADASGEASGGFHDYFDYDLDAERKIRSEIEEWRFFRVADKPSEADFVFLINLNASSIEGLAISREDYTRHFKDKFDLDSLRDAAYGRYLAGPLKLPTISRLSDRLVKQFRERLTRGGTSVR
ncbi:MAG: hypothetical protein QOC61_2173 [Acidobacteriota bacterium]|jgi:hypothetical protein|nr:hypothetical protein [Acidobacteriota bacterium]MDT5263169.1 hypothetical protein [Acidobacteriota bacterium]MDT7779414.1 hypothetical protein [Acidobacteriota bacterium]